MHGPPRLIGRGVRRGAPRRRAPRGQDRRRRSLGSTSTSGIRRPARDSRTTILLRAANDHHERRRGAPRTTRFLRGIQQVSRSPSSVLRASRRTVLPIGSTAAWEASMSRSRPKSRRSAGIPAGIGRQAYRARTRSGVLGILAALVSCVAISACSVPGAAPPYDDRVLLGQGGPRRRAEAGPGDRPLHVRPGRHALRRPDLRAALRVHGRLHPSLSGRVHGPPGRQARRRRARSTTSA